MTTEGVSPDHLGYELLSAINRTYPRFPGAVLGRAWLAVAQALAGAHRPARIAYAFYGMTRSAAHDRDVPAYVVASDSALLILVTARFSTETPSLPESFDLTEVPLASVGLDVRKGLFLDRVTISYREPTAQTPHQLALRRVAHRPVLEGLRAMINDRRSGSSRGEGPLLTGSRGED